MVEHVQPGGIEINAVFDVADEGVVGPAVPQSRDDVIELAAALVAFAVRHVLLMAEIQRRVGVGGRDQVPAGAAVADVVERGEFAGDVVGVVVGGRCGGDQAEPLGDHRERGQQGERVERGDGGAALERGHRHVQHGEMVGHEEGVELAALEGLREALEVGEVEIGVGERARVAPPRRMDADRAHEGAEPQLPPIGHRNSVRPLHTLQWAIVLSIQYGGMK